MKMIFMEKTVGGFVGANSFARIMSYVRMKLHLRMQTNSMKLWETFRQLPFYGG